MDDLRQELKEKLDKILHVYIFAQETYLYTEYFHNPETQEERELVFHSAHSNDLSTIMHLMFRTLVVETSKLFSRSINDKFQLEKLISALSPSGHFRKAGIPITHIESWRKQLLDNNETIENILLIRDKLYAHTDNPLADYNEIDISFKKIKVLLGIAANILYTVFHDLYDTELILDSPGFDRHRFGILKLLAKAETERKQEIVNKYMNWRENGA
ncbi:MAG: hypothetical protein ACTHML_09560 [Ginsengibacter sp.]